jgi:low molecular weight protein-tyrosine phosphatase
MRSGRGKAELGILNLSQSLENLKPETSTVLFLCSGNFYRSRFAEAYFNFHTALQGLAWTAESRGFRLNSKNVGPISEHAAFGLQHRGIPLADPQRMPLVATQHDLARCQLVVAMKESEHRPLMRTHFGAWADRIEYWRIHDLDCSQPQSALADLERELRNLIVRLKVRPEA